VSDEFVELIGNIGTSLGLSKVACQLYGLLFIRGEPLSLDQMTDELGVSKGNVSVNIRALERWEAVRKVWRKGTRKDYYRAEEDIERIITTRLSEGLSKRLEMIRDYVESCDGGVGGVNSEQLQKLEGYVERARMLVEFLRQDSIGAMRGE